MFEKLGIDNSLSSATIPWIDWVTISSRKRILKLRDGIPRTEHDLKYLQDHSTYVDYCTKNVFGSFKTREAVRKHAKPTRIERSFDQESKEIYENMFTSISSNLNGEQTRLGRVKSVSTSFPLSISHTGQVLRYKQSINSETIPSINNEFIEEKDLNYIHYLDHSDVKSWHESYQYLIGVLSDRVEMDKHNFQNAVQFWENILFER